MNAIAGQTLDRVLEAAVIRNWPDLVPDGNMAQIHIEYEFGKAGNIAFLQIWSSQSRGIWHLVCTFAVGASSASSSGIQFANGYASSQLQKTLTCLLEHQDVFVPPPNLHRNGLVQIAPPSKEEKAAAAVLIDQALERVESQEAVAV